MEWRLGSLILVILVCEEHLALPSLAILPYRLRCLYCLSPLTKMVFSSASTPLARARGSFGVSDQLGTMEKGKDRAAEACWPNTQFQSLESRRNRVTLSIFNDSWKDLMAVKTCSLWCEPSGSVLCLPSQLSPPELSLSKLSPSVLLSPLKLVNGQKPQGGYELPRAKKIRVSDRTASRHRIRALMIDKTSSHRGLVLAVRVRRDRRTSGVYDADNTLYCPLLTLSTE